jgi:hypothetical protein
VGAATIWGLDSSFQSVLSIPVSEISAVHVEEADDRWLVRVRRVDRLEELSYRGIFAEHFARVAESTIRGVMHSSLPILPRARAAKA